MPMRPSVIRMRRGVVRRRTCRRLTVCLCCMTALLCFEVRFFAALIWAAIFTLLLEIFLFRKCW